ncbi:MAG: hypothetical protein HC808_10310 [Candidatus Competibacteraceae bacterium]|nr:hypothetical protein [Candidatus Competibacteraceae bacterium]
MTETAGQTSVLPETVNTAASQLRLIGQDDHAEVQVSAPTFTLWAGNNTTAAVTKESPALQPIRGETQSLEKSKPAKSPWLFVLLFLFIVLLGGAGAFLLWRQQNASAPPQLFGNDSRTNLANLSTSTLPFPSMPGAVRSDIKPEPPT